jgi:predicted Zn-dependent peptidase
LAKGSDLLIVDVTARPETNPEQLEEEVEREIDALVANGVTEEEVERAVALIQTDMVTAMQSASERADRLSMFATLLDDPALINEQAARYSSVSAEEVNNFVRNRLGADNRAKLLYVPRGKSEESREDALTEAVAS